MNEKTFRTLEFYKVLENVAKFANSSITKNQILDLKCSKNLNEIKVLQRETSEAVSMILKKGSLRIGGLRDIYPFLKRVSSDGVLNFSELLNIADFLNSCKIAKDYATSDSKNENFELLMPKFDSIELIESLNKEITRCILSDSEMADNASNTILDIRLKIKSTNDKIKSDLNKIIQSQTYKSIMQEPIITLKGDRYCIPVKAEFKSSFPGIIHEHSASGATVFMEPSSVVNSNNKLKDLSLSEKQEINKILKNLSEKVNDNKDIILSNIEILKDIDFIFAKGEYSISINGIEPIFNQKGYINLKKARHPLIEKSKVVPIDIYIGKDFTTLLITGPNTGGKTVTLKTVGLFSIMGQAGLHIPAFDKSELAVFDNIFSDIGDEQSIEQNLSTFSSHMKNIIKILEEVTENSLVLFDELGAGTDPTEGACLAISIIEHLHKRGIRSITTTHYNELKVFSISKEGVYNASCEFDVNTLEPTYRLLIGIPGKSNAFAISKRLGLPEFIIDGAKSLISSEVENFEDVITELEVNKRELLIEKEKAEKYRLEAESLKEDLELQKNKIKVQKEKIILKANQEAKEIVFKAKLEADEVIKNIQKLAKEKNNINELNLQRQKLQKGLSYIDSKLTNILSKNQPKRVLPKNLKKGDKVFVHSLAKSAVVVSEPNSKGEVMVLAGILNFKTTLKDLSIDSTPEEKVKQPQNIKKRFNSNIKQNKVKGISFQIDLRGLYADEAIDKVDKFIDDAYLAGMDIINVIHGKGTGALRTAIHNFLRKHSKVKSYRLGEFGEGDAGVTVVELK